MNPGPAPSLFASFGFAWQGVLHVAAHQRNMKLHLVAALMVGLVGSGIPLGLAEKVTLLFCVMLVLFAETLNAALEALVDLHTERFHELAKVVKDTAAGGVLLLASGTVVIFAALVVHNWPLVVAHAQAVVRQLAVGSVLVACGIALVSNRPRPPWVDRVVFASGLVVLAVLATWTTSVVFTCLTSGLFWIMYRVARAHAKARAGR